MFCLRPPVEPVQLSISDASNEPRTSIGARRNPESTRAILDAAASLLGEIGYTGFSIDAIARRARCGKPTVYRWWPDKLALLVELHEVEMAELPVPQTIPEWMAEIRRFWRSSLAGPALRAMAAEAQLTADGHERLRAAVAPYEAAARATPEGKTDPAYARTAASVAIFEWLADADSSEVRALAA